MGVPECCCFPVARPRLFLQRTVTRNLILAVDRGLETWPFAMLWLMAYTYLLRVPSEALPAVRGGGEFDPPPGLQTLVYLEEHEGRDTLCVKLASRKNKIGGSLLRRACSCRGCPKTCPVHVLWHRFFALLETGTQPWHGVTPAAALAHLRLSLQSLQVGAFAASSMCAHRFARS